MSPNSYLILSQTTPRSVCSFFALAMEPVLTLPLRSDDSRSAVAILGMSCRFPGGIENPAVFWDLLRDGRCTASKVPFSRWDVDAEIGHDKKITEQTGQCMSWGSFVQGLDMFDATFFGISAAEASVMDPQQRLLLECAYLALLDAGYTKESVFGAYHRFPLSDFDLIFTIYCAS